MAMGQDMYYDIVGESGEVTYHVSAMYEEDGTGVMSEANSNMVTVDLQNAAPTAVVIAVFEISKLSLSSSSGKKAMFLKGSKNCTFASS